MEAMCKVSYVHTHSGDGGVEELTLGMVTKVDKHRSLLKVIKGRPRTKSLR